MRIVIDMQGAQSAGSKNRGIGRYTISFAKALIANKANHEIILLLNGSFIDATSSLQKDFSQILPVENIKVWYPIEDKQGYEKISQAIQSNIINSLNPDFLIISSLFEGYIDDCIYSTNNNASIKTAIILYDLIPYIYKHIYLKDEDSLNWYLNRIEMMKKADLLLSISESSRQEAIEYIKFPANKVCNISTAADEQFQEIQINQTQYDHIKLNYGLQKKFIMYTGGIDHRKNIDSLILAYAKLDKNILNNYQLAIVCSIQEHDKIRLYELANQHGLPENNIIFTGFVPEQDLILLYNLCYLFVFPSWHEGFGLPALEAMQCNAPVIVSNISSLPEVIGYDDALFNPHSVESIYEKINQVLTDNDFRLKLIHHAKLQVKKFSWNLTALTALQVLEKNYNNEIIINNNLPISSNLKKIAYISPVPSAHSGIADYSAELLPQLSKYYDITLILNQNEVSKNILEKFNIRNINWFKNNYKNFDRVIYHFGNSEFHEHMFDLIKEIPGIVVLHDFFVSNICAYIEEKNGNYTFDLELYKSHGYQALRDKYMSIEKAIIKYPANFSILEKAVGIITHSDYAKKLGIDYYQKKITKNWQVIPLLKNSNIEINKQQSRTQLNINNDDFIVCSFGILGESKKNLDLIKAWINSNLSKQENCKLIFVGFNDKNTKYGQELINFISEHDKNSQITITDWVEKEKFIQYLSVCDIAVQLRGFSRGETSAAVLDTMNYGVATIVNANGSMAELPKSSVYMLEDNFNIQDLTNALDTLWQDKHLRSNLSKNARNFITENHQLQECAEKYYTSIEDFYTTYQNLDNIIDTVALICANSNADINEEKIKIIAYNLALNFPRIRPNNQIFIDISDLIYKQHNNEKQTLLKNQLIYLFDNTPKNFRIEPIYFDISNQAYKYARNFSLKFLHINSELNKFLLDETIEHKQSDIFLIDDEYINIMMKNHKKIYNLFYKQGVEFIDMDKFLNLYSH